MQQNYPQRKPQRLKAYDYRNPGHYFLTIAVYHRLPLFGYKSHGLVYLNPTGLALAEILDQTNDHYPPEVLSMDCYAIMPDHIHLMVTLGDGSVSIPDFVSRLKTYAAQSVNESIRKNHTMAYQQQLWQKSYYDHMVRDEHDYHEIIRYIRQNPRKDFSMSLFFDEYIPEKSESDDTDLTAYFLDWDAV